MNPDEFKLLIL